MTHLRWLELEAILLSYTLFGRSFTGLLLFGLFLIDSLVYFGAKV